MGDSKPSRRRSLREYLVHLSNYKSPMKLNHYTKIFDRKFRVGHHAPQKQQSPRPLCRLLDLPHELLAYMCVFLDAADFQTFLTCSPLLASWISRGAAQQVEKLKLRERYVLESQLAEKSILQDTGPYDLRYFHFYHTAMILLWRHEKLLHSKSRASTAKVKSGYTYKFYKHLVPGQPYQSSLEFNYGVPTMDELCKWVQETQDGFLGRARIFEKIEWSVCQLAKDVQRFLCCPCLQISDEHLSLDCIYDGLLQMWAFSWQHNLDVSNPFWMMCNLIPTSNRLNWLRTQPKRSRKNLKALLENLSKAFGQLGSLSFLINSKKTNKIPEPLRTEYKRFIRSRHQYWFIGFLMRNSHEPLVMTTGFMRVGQWIRGEPCLCDCACSCYKNTVDAHLKSRWKRWRAQGKWYRRWIRQASLELGRPATYDDFEVAGDFPQHGGFEKLGRQILMTLEKGAVQ